MKAVAQRYARAAVEAAVQEAVAAGDSLVAAADRLVADLARCREALAASAPWREVLFNPAFRPQRDAVVMAVLQHLAVTAVASRTVQILVRSGRLPLLAQVCQAAEALADERSGRLRALVSSAVELSAEQEERLVHHLERRFGKTIELTKQIDGELLGGLVCRVMDWTFDGSLRRQLELIEARL